MNSNFEHIKDLTQDNSFVDWVNNATPDECEKWEAWLKLHPERKDDVELARQLILNVKDKTWKLSDKDKSSLWSQISLSAGIEEGSRHESLPGSHGTRWIGLTLKVAASLLLLCAFAFIIYHNREFINIKPSDNLADRVTFESPVGKRSTITLSDSTVVRLNSGSQITFSKGFTPASREVILYGEAFFEVAKDKDRPFRVISGDIMTTALGTSFNVKMGLSTEVSLVTGVVSVQPVDDDNSKVYLAVGDQAVYRKENHKLNKQKFNYREIIGWKDNIICFKNASADYVFDYLGKWYGLSVEVQNKTETTWSYSGEFQNMKLNDVLSSIGYTMKFDYRITRNKVLINYKH